MSATPRKFPRHAQKSPPINRRQEPFASVFWVMWQRRIRWHIRCVAARRPSVTITDDSTAKEMGVEMNALQATVADWLQIIRGEFQEMPGLQLTRSQAQRLWGVDASTCDALLDELVSSRFLKRTHSGTYARVDAGC
jgi:hypothetical protein